MRPPAWAMAVAVVEEHNLVRDAVINRLIAFLRSSDGLLKSLGLPTRVGRFFHGGVEDMPTSPMKTIEYAQGDPFYYLRTACSRQYGCGIWDLPLPKQLHGFSCHLLEEDVPGTPEHAAKQRESEELSAALGDFEANLTPIKGAKGVDHA